MSETHQADRLLVERIRAGDADAWADLIARYEGRLLAFAESRIRNHDVSEDIVQESFIGFLNSLPNFDGRRALESYLFTICAHKLTDHLRREGRRPTLPLAGSSHDENREWQIPGNARPASSIARSVERRRLEEDVLVEALRQQLDHWRRHGEWLKIKCMELLFVRGKANKEVAALLEISEQQVANFKFDFVTRLRSQIRKLGPSQDVFPELYE